MSERRVKHLAEYLLFRGLLLVLSRLSWTKAQALGRALGSLTWRILRIRRRVTLDNLEHAFPDLPPFGRREIARSCYRQFGSTFLELCQLPRVAPPGILARTRITHPEYFEEARAQGRGAILLTGHIGNWEVGGAAVAQLGHPTWVLVRPQNNRRVDAYVTRARESSGMRVLSTDRGLRPVMRLLAANEFLAILADQDAGRDGVFVPFFGRPASTPLGPVRFARLARCPIIFGYGLRQPDGSFLLEMPPPLRVREDLPPLEAEMEALRRSVSYLEEMVRRYPDQWFWMHRRWKTAPPEADPAAGGARAEVNLRKRRGA